MNDRTTIYGIKACSTMQKAQAWLAAHGVDAIFHDYKKSGIDAETLSAWCAKAGWEKLLNRSGTTFRKLNEADKHDLDAARAQTLMLRQPSMIRRPVLVRNGRILIGFSPETYAAFCDVSD